MITREAFLDEAVATLRQEVPENLEWLPWRELPPMRWAGDRATVDQRIPRGWLVAAALREEPEPNADMLERASMFNDRDAAALGSRLLQAWIAYDTKTTELTESRKQELRTIAERAAKMAERFGRGGTDPEERYRQLLAQEGSRPASTALPHQGLLAIVATCADGSVASHAQDYLSTWHDERPARCRALLRMLSWIDAPAAQEALEASGCFPQLHELVGELVKARGRRTSLS